MSWRAIVGSFWRCLGLIVLPNLACSFGQVTDSVRLGRKSSITGDALDKGYVLNAKHVVPVGMISAFRSLVY